MIENIYQKYPSCLVFGGWWLVVAGQGWAGLLKLQVQAKAPPQPAKPELKQGRPLYQPSDLVRAWQATVAQSAT